MSRHQYDLVQCMKRTGTHIGMVCPLCDGRCPICDSFVKPTTKVRICDECVFQHQAKCILCGHNLGENAELGSPTYYCLECVRLEKDREGCPRIINIGSSRADMIHNKKKSGTSAGLLR